MIHPDGYWMPNLSEKQQILFNDRHVYQLAAGPVMSGKTLGVAQKIIRHMWETPGARVATFAKTVKSAKHGGSYDDLTKLIIPEWKAANMTGKTSQIKFGYTVEPKVDGATRTHHFKLRNWHGGESEFFLFSLDYDDDAEEKLKNTRFSCIWFIELTNFSHRDIWSISSSRLRMPHLKPDEHLWIADTNPSEEGQASWIYKLFYEKQGFDPVEDAWTMDQINVHEIMIEDNPFLDSVTIQKIKAENRHDKDLYDRYVLGKWTAASKGGHFTDVFVPEHHVQGTATGNNRDSWEVIVPGESTFELVSGFDIGQVSHSWHLAQKRTGPDGLSCYDIIDECVSVDRQVSIRDFIEAVMERIDTHLAYMKEQYGRENVQLKCWSDTSAFDYRSTTNSTEDRLVYIVSDGKLALQGVTKGRNSIKARVDLVRRLLFERRLFISAQLFETIKMIKGLKRGNSALDYVSNSQSLKHCFDSFSYLLIGEEPLEILSRLPGVSKRNKRHLISVPA